MTLPAACERDLRGDLPEAFGLIRQIPLLIAVDHARAGSNYFTRLFDQHPEVLSLPYVSYLYTGLLDIAGRRGVLPGKEAFEHVTTASNVSLLVNDPTPSIRAQLIRMGNDPEAPIDRDVLRQVLRALVRDQDSVTPADVIRAVYLGYALATGRSIRPIRYLLLTESVSSRDRATLEAADKEFPSVRVIHLVRDPRANFASLRHQYINQWRSMYPLDRLVQGEEGCTWLWVLLTTTRGAGAVRSWKSSADPRRVFTVRNEDLNLRFVPTLERLTRWLEVGWFEPWSSPGYVPTSNGRPWGGVSAFSNTYQPFTQGPLSNDPPSQDRSCGPNREVTERWKKRLPPREIAFLEAVYEREMGEQGYSFMFLGQGQSKFRALLNILFPLAGEFPPARWYTRFNSGPDVFRKVSYPFLLPFAYVLSRICFLFLYLRGEFR